VLHAFDDVREAERVAVLIEASCDLEDKLPRRAGIHELATIIRGRPDTLSGGASPA